MAKDELNNKLLNLTIEEKNAIVQFNTLLNRKHDTEILIPDSVYLIEEHSFSKDSILKFNPTVKRAKELINYSDQLLRESKLLRYPKIGIGLDYVFVGERQDLNPEGNGKDIVMPMISMSIPIFGKKNKAKINESKLKSEEFNLKKEALENDLIAEFESGLFDLESAINDYKLYQELIIKADRTLAILRTAYETSGKDYDQVLSLENKVLAYRLGVLKALVKIKTIESYLEYLSNQ